MKKGSKQKSSKQNQQTDATTTCKKLFFKSSKQKKHNSQGDFVKLFPLEVNIKIFSKLDIHSLCNAAITCKSWNQTIEHCDDLWKQHCLNIRAVCQREVDGDRGKGYSWKVTLHRNYWKSKVKYEWLSGKYSNIQSRSNLPEKCMYPMDVDTWGEILEAELERVLYRGN
ncbi:F-box only protein 48 [Ahaetulla prasina]|uniref:F-box only protein 48 n=1 Tax=Ahaetulla prasina TaxID=499056 RepID=UPI002647248D|nr:F-box only protein 48 [Ahaetulla prasina]XP_058038051.1 F-box only protein 48 [Ahaetulla prasina]XP_058038056.1 F-box only protein 48 [Ahaetulla prasina]XP_058038065.1 F-box only protein 48 [Ahaetulla prasina]